MRDELKLALDEVGAALAGVDTDTIEQACVMVAEAGSVGLYGCGREGLQLRGFAMRLYHLGCRAVYLGEMTTPPLGPGDLLIVSAGPGELATVSAMMRTARDAGARILFVTSVAKTASASLADGVLAIPAQTMASDRGKEASAILPMGSAYEGAMFFLFEIMIHRLKALMGVSPEEMRARHTNME